jgi:hypothetical protein
MCLYGKGTHIVCMPVYNTVKLNIPNNFSAVYFKKVGKEINIIASK